MKLTLTTSEMLDRWRLHSAFQPPLTDAIFRRNDGIDTDALFTAEMNGWYRRLLAGGDHSQLAPRSLSDSVSLSADSGGATVISLPAGTVRVLSVRLASWLRPARIVTDPDPQLLMCQTNPYTRATVSSPLALFSRGELRLYPAALAGGDSLLCLDCVVFEEGIYEFDDSALAALHPETPLPS